jgi:ABC-type lipoprotein release transport system permease subunit
VDEMENDVIGRIGMNPSKKLRSFIWRINLIGIVGAIVGILAIFATWYTTMGGNLSIKGE